MQYADIITLNIFQPKIFKTTSDHLNNDLNYSKWVWTPTPLEGISAQLRTYPSGSFWQGINHIYEISMFSKVIRSFLQATHLHSGSGSTNSMLIHYGFTET